MRYIDTYMHMYTQVGEAAAREPMLRRVPTFGVGAEGSLDDFS